MPTYFDTKQSKAYTRSKELIKKSNVVDAIVTLEVGIKFKLELLADSLADEDDIKRVELHESLAPLYYLYGTALLFSLQEDAASGLVRDEYDDEVQNALDNLTLALIISSRLVHDFHPQNKTGSTTTEVLDDTRTIPLKSSTHSYYTPAQQTELLLDLAQIRTHIGDWQRHANANILSSIEEYTQALTLHMACLGKFDKRVGYSHYSLAGAYATATYAEAPNSEDPVKLQQKSLEHYFACAVVFAAAMAKMCGEDAEKFYVERIEREDTEKFYVESLFAGGTAASSYSNPSAKSLVTIREILAKLVAPPSPSGLLAKEFDSMKKIIDEVLEAMNIADAAEEGLKSVGGRKSEAIWGDAKGNKESEVKRRKKN